MLQGSVRVGRREWPSAQQLVDPAEGWVGTKRRWPNGGSGGSGRGRHSAWGDGARARAHGCTRWNLAEDGELGDVFLETDWAATGRTRHNGGRKVVI
ncbi:hypothetical protein E2562_023282 [Oryza meyeriana var. granulata]|uniref:Uncharacterized protein n=1 Tax=Oryza meyeriana var. granulata TaxID=110450 RepID=A0A6G1DN73_9ORYZ|nr:hypothetical protein E2562_023282 [Oryza meyeriana var. granulata]